MLEKCLAETDPEITDVIVVTAHVMPPAGSSEIMPSVTDQDRALLTAVVTMAEAAGKPVKPLIVPTNEPMYALTRIAHILGAQELIMGASNKYDPTDQLDQVALYWLNVCESGPAPLTVRVMGKDRDVRLDIAGGSGIPRVGERTSESAQTLADLRASWHGVGRLLLAYDGSALSADFLDTVLSFLDPMVHVTLIDVTENGGASADDPAMRILQAGAERANKLGRSVDFRAAKGDAGPEIVRAALEGKFDAIFMSLRGEYRRHATTALAPTTRYVLENAPCRVVLGFPPKSIPMNERGPVVLDSAHR
jgi:nucleotide-binding universal stress UspA family protein